METVDLKLVLLGARTPDHSRFSRSSANPNTRRDGVLRTLLFSTLFASLFTGQPGVGKTCLVYRYLYNTFGETISTIGASFAMKKVELDGGRPCNLGIWDTAGQERFDSLSSFYCRGARAAIICFDLTDRASFECLQQKWIRKGVRACVCVGCTCAQNMRLCFVRVVLSAVAPRSLLCAHSLLCCYALLRVLQ